MDSALVAENLVTDREPSTLSSVEDILSERAVARAPVQLCLDLGHPFVRGGSAQDRGTTVRNHQAGHRDGALPRAAGPAAARLGRGRERLLDAVGRDLAVPQDAGVDGVLRA